MVVLVAGGCDGVGIDAADAAGAAVAAAVLDALLLWVSRGITLSATRRA